MSTTYIVTTARLLARLARGHLSLSTRGLAEQADVNFEALRRTIRNDPGGHIGDASLRAISDAIARLDVGIPWVWWWSRISSSLDVHLGAIWTNPGLKSHRYVIHGYTGEPEVVPCTITSTKSGGFEGSATIGRAGFEYLRSRHESTL